MVHKLYLRDLGLLLRDKVIAAKDDLDQRRVVDDSGEQHFARGILAAYVEAIVLMRQQGQAFGLSPEELSLAGFDPAHDLLGEPRVVERDRESAARNVPASDERVVCQRYLVAVVGKLRRRAIDAKEQDEEQRGLESENQRYLAGRMMGYIEVISLMQQQAIGFQIPLHHIGLEGIDPERDFLGPLPPGGVAELRRRWMRT